MPNIDSTPDSDWSIIDFTTPEPPAGTPERTEWMESAFRNLLARVHRDGGHHTAAVGLRQSWRDADHRVAELNAMADSTPDPAGLLAKVAEEVRVTPLEEPESRFPTYEEHNAYIKGFAACRKAAAALLARRAAEAAASPEGDRAGGEPESDPEEIRWKLISMIFNALEQRGMDEGQPVDGLSTSEGVIRVDTSGGEFVVTVARSAPPAGDARAALSAVPAATGEDSERARLAIKLANILARAKEEHERGVTCTDEEAAPPVKELEDALAAYMASRLLATHTPAAAMPGTATQKGGGE